MGGPGSGPKPGDRPQITTAQRRHRRKQSLAAMYPTSLRLISRSLNYEIDKGEDQPVETEDSWKVIHMLDGVPRQQVDTNLRGEVVIRVVYEAEPCIEEAKEDG